jgi:hypothetical protein
MEAVMTDAGHPPEDGGKIIPHAIFVPAGRIIPHDVLLVAPASAVRDELQESLTAAHLGTLGSPATTLAVWPVIADPAAVPAALVEQTTESDDSATELTVYLPHTADSDAVGAVPTGRIIPHPPPQEGQIIPHPPTS